MNVIIAEQINLIEEVCVPILKLEKSAHIETPSSRP